MEINAKPKYNAVQNVFWMIKNAWKSRKRTLLFCVLTALLEVAVNLLQLFISPEILRKVEQTVPLAELLCTIGVFAALLFITTGVKQYIQSNTLFARVDVRSYIVGLISYKCNTTSYPNNYDPRFIKLREKAHMAVEGNAAAGEHIWATLTAILQNIGGFGAYLFILSGLHPALLLLITVAGLAGCIASNWADDWNYRHRDEEETAFAHIQYVRGKAESIALAKDVRIFGLQNWLNDIHLSAVNLYGDFLARRARVYLFSDLVGVLLTVARNGIAYAYLLWLVLEKGLSASDFLLYFTAVSGFTAWVSGILQEVSRLHKESLDISRIREFLEYPEPFLFEGGAPVPEASGYMLQLERVSFRYPEAQRDTIHALNLTVKPGEKLAIVGLNGAGKTTLVKLLSGLLDPTEGRVLLNGQDIRTFDRRAYYSLFSAVFQEFSVLDVTVAENVSQQAENTDMAKVERCLEQAGLTQAVAALPKGVETHVGREVYHDGVLFSGGQLQRLMLARALYKDGPILLLDEPTAALDPLAENAIYQQYSEMTAGKTALFISHRLASTQFCDRIIFVADGGIQEEGTHESLLAQKGAYAALFEVQSRYYKQGRAF